MAEHDAEPRRVKENRTPGKPRSFLLEAVRIMQDARLESKVESCGII